MRRDFSPMGNPDSEWRLIPNGQARMSDGGKVHGGFPFAMVIGCFCPGGNRI